MRRAMQSQVGRDETRGENKKTLMVLLGVMLALIAISVVTILVKH